MLRSEDMAICDVYIQKEAGFDVLSRIGELECVQFKDMNWDVLPILRHYVSDLCRCVEMEQNLNYIKEEITQEGIKIPRLRDLSQVKPLHPTEMFEFENMIDSWTKDVKDIAINKNNLKKLYSETDELHYLIHHLDPIIGDVEMGTTKLPREMLQSERSYDHRQLKIVTGVVERSSSYPFQSMLWRVSHGNIYYREAAHDDDFLHHISGRKVRKVAFVIICYGDELHQRILKVCNGFNVKLYRWPEKHDDRMATMKQLSSRMREMDKVLQRTKYQRAATFRNISLEWETWMTQVMKAKAVYYQLNLFNIDSSTNALIGQCWVPDNRYDEVEAALESASQMVGARSFIVRTAPCCDAIVPPTYYTTNRFTEGFQGIINSYQLGRYKELNPGIFAIITFPFLFGVMFGDVGHGFLLFLYGLWMINQEKKYMYRTATNEVWNVIFKGRYIIMMMGVFSIYMGFLYNEWFSLTCKMMSPYWLNPYSGRILEADFAASYPIPSEEGQVGYVYKFGIDPGIKFSENAIPTESTVKMKLAIILGVAHIVLGLLANFWNHLYFKKYYAVFLHFLPKVLFVLCIFGFLCYLIIDKWLFPIHITEFKYKFPQVYAIDFRPYLPSLTDEFLHFVLWTEKREPHKKYTHATALLDKDPQFYAYNLDLLEVVLYHTALACLFVLLLGSPIYLYLKHRMQTGRLEREKSYAPYTMRCQESVDLKKYQYFDVGWLLLRRVWLTVEFALATISHMASYLRLWALSFAHSLLSDFVWQETIRRFALRDFTRNGIWKLYIVFVLWALITVFFLIIMHSLAVFVHVLRLHWIEFMSKFFKGDGVPFRPFTLSTVLDEPDVKREEETNAMCRLRQANESAGDY